MRSIGKGAISFGLVNIRAPFTPATRREEFRFHFLRKCDLTPINNKCVAEADGKEVAWQDIVRGYRYEKGKFIVLNDDDSTRVDVGATQTVDIQEFVEVDEINPILRGTKRVGIAKVVIKTREHLAAVKAQDDALVLELMHFSGEIIGSEKLPMPGEAKIGKKETDMAKQLVESMTGKWNPEKYKDDSKEALMDVIEEKVAAGGKTVTKPGKTKSAKATNVIDLVAVLQKSIQEHGSSRSKKAPAKKARRKAA